MVTSLAKNLEKSEVDSKPEGDTTSPVLVSPVVDQPPVAAEMKVKKILGVNRVYKETYTHTWKMKNFDEIPFISKFPLYSPSFSLGMRNDSTWQVCMTKHIFCHDKDNESDDEEGHSECDEETSKPSDIPEELPEADAGRVKRLGLRLVKDDYNTSWDIVEYNFTLKTPDGYSVTTDLKTEPGIEEFGSTPIYTYLCDGDFGERNLFNEKNLDIICNITYKYLGGGSLAEPSAFKEMQFTSDLRLLYSHKKFSDLLLVVKGAEIEVHKSILYARAPGFGTLLNDNKKSPKQTLELNMDAEVAKAMVYFMYSGKIADKFPLEKCFDLHEAAETYGVNKLKDFCSRYFVLNLDSGVCRECLGIQQLFDDCLEEIRKLGSGKIKQILSKCPCSHQNIVGQ